MQTQCPHCDTQFRITESQLNSADGFVRCGVCQEVFNAIKVAAQHKQQHSLLDNETTSPLQQPEIHADDFKHMEETSPDEPATPVVESESETSDVDVENLPDNKPEKNEFDFFDEDHLSSQNRVVPDEFRDTHSSVKLSTLMWSAGTLILVASLFLEYTWFNRHQLNQLPELQVWIDKLCTQVDCGNISVRDPENIELISRNVYSHPNKNQALMIAITIKNNAEFAQPYPVMQVDFSDIRGGSVAARRFLPSEYLNNRPGKSGLIHSGLINAGSNISFTMEIVDPGKQAQTYEFNFL